jgi:hypothetical protein
LFEELFFLPLCLLLGIVVVPGCLVGDDLVNVDEEAEEEEPYSTCKKSMFVDTSPTCLFSFVPVHTLPT